MRRKIAKRLRRKLLSLGCEIRNPHFIKEPGWKRKDCGYAAEIIFNKGHHDLFIDCIANDELECYRWALEEVMEEIRNSFPTEE